MKLVRSNSRITKIVLQWIPDCRTGRCKSAMTDNTEDAWYIQLMASGGSWVLATSDFRDGNAVIGKVRRCLTPETSVNGHGKFVLHPLRNVKPVQFIVEQPWQTSIVHPSARDQMCCGIQHPLQLISDRLQWWGEDWVAVVHARCNKGVN